MCSEGLPFSMAIDGISAFRQMGQHFVAVTF